MSMLFLLVLLSLIQWSSLIEPTTQPVMFESNETTIGTTSCSIGNETCTTPSLLSTTAVSRHDTAASAGSDVNLTTMMSNASVSTMTATTPVPNSTVSTTPEPTTAKPAVPAHSVIKKTDQETDLTEGNACTCDLTANECESNCCCDPDCRPYQLTVFSSCLPRPRPLFDDRMCHVIKTVVVNNTEQLVEETRPGALCIVKTNLAAWVIHPTRPAILSQSKFDRTWSRTRTPSWLKAEPKVEERSNLSSAQKPYIQDSFLWKFHPQHVHTFDLPSPSVSLVCSAKRPVRFLRPWRKTCLQQTPKTRSECQKQSTDYFLQKMNIVSNPSSVNRTELALHKAISCPQKLCAPVFSFNCSEEAVATGKFSSCQNITKSMLFLFNGKTNVCHGIVKDLRMVFFHNGTEGINSLMVYFSVVNISTANPVLLQRSFSVDFQWSTINSSKSYHNRTGENATLVEATKRSGHPGYVVGKPLRSGHRYKLEDPKQNSDSVKRGEDALIKEKIRLSGTQDVLSVFGPGPCELSKRHPVLFGEDVHVTCGFTLRKSHFSSSQNCTDLRVEVLRHLLGSFNSKKLLKASTVETWGIVIGTFGDSSPNDLSDWIPLIVDGLSVTPAELSRTENRSSSEDLPETLKCDDILAALEIRVLHSFVGSINNPQSKIIGTAIRFEPAQDLQWHCESDMEDCAEPLHLTASVKFVDVSSPAVAKYAEPPGIHIRLPPDFFYPFMVARNSHGKVISRIDLNIFLCILLFLRLAYL